MENTRRSSRPRTAQGPSGESQQSFSDRMTRRADASDEPSRLEIDRSSEPSVFNPNLYNPRLCSLPAEILVEIAEFLDVASLWQFMQTSERYYSIGIKALRNVILTEPNQGREIVFWAAEAGNHRALKDVLERGVDPNGVYFSPILASRMADAMNGGPIHPCPTLNSLSVESQTALDFEIEREILCRHEVIRNHHFSQEGVTEISQQSSRHSSGGFGEAGFVSSGIFAPDAWRTLHDPSLRGVAPWGTAASDKKYRKLWYWCPIHVAAKSGDNVAIELLLKHGAKINAVCSGLCSCSYPHLSANQFSSFKDTVNPLCTRSLWTPLHVAMCHGHRHTVQLLVEKRASEWIGGVRSPPHNEISSSHEVGRFQCRMSAIDYAAWKGDAELCEFLLAQTPSPIPVTFSQCTPIYWAAAGGHIQTIGNLLFNYDSARCLDAVAKQSRLMRSFCSVLEILCTDQRYDDATWLLEKCRRHGAFTSMDHRDSFGQSLTAALGRLCGIERPANHTLDLRQQQDLLSRKGAPDSAAKEFERRARDSENDRVVLAAKLLRYGADPNLELTTWSNRHGYKYPPIYFAATACFPKMVKLLIQSGASLTLPQQSPFPHRRSVLPNVPWGSLLLVPLIGQFSESLREQRYDIFKTLVESGADGEGLQDAWFKGLSLAGVPLLLQDSSSRELPGEGPEEAPDNGLGEQRKRQTTVAFLFSALRQENGDISSPYSMTRLLLERGAAKDLTDEQWCVFLTAACTKADAIAESNYSALVRYRALPPARLADLFRDIFAYWAVKTPAGRTQVAARWSYREWTSSYTQERATK